MNRQHLKRHTYLAALAFVGLAQIAPACAQQPVYQTLSEPPPAQLLPALPAATGAPPTLQQLGQPPAQASPAAISDAPGGAPTIVATTTEKIDGYHVRRYLGVVRGIKVFQPSIGQNLRAGLRGIIGGNISSYSEMIEKARQEAYDQLLQRSTALGANAVVGLRYDSSAFGLNGSAEMGTEVICYGTAVYLEADPR